MSQFRFFDVANGKTIDRRGGQSVSILNIGPCLLGRAFNGISSRAGHVAHATPAAWFDSFFLRGAEHWDNHVRNPPLGPAFEGAGPFFIRSVRGKPHHISIAVVTHRDVPRF
jgi:hypothetical protein